MPVNEPLILRDGTVHRLGQYYVGRPAQDSALELHRHLFERGNPTYTPPEGIFVEPHNLPPVCCGYCTLETSG